MGICLRYLRYGRRNKIVYIFIILIFVIFIRNLIVSSKPILYIVEEHHEALWYWLFSANVGLLPSSGSILIHIDAHSDDSMPSYFEGMPLFQAPSNEFEASFFLQRNDVFIKSSIITGLIDSFIWIYPTWSNSTVLVNKASQKAIGVHQTNESLFFCECIEEEDNCYYIDWQKSEEADSLFEAEIDQKFCNIHTSFNFLQMRETSDLEGLTSLITDRNVILDIDEDFFGCRLGSSIFGPSLNDQGDAIWNSVVKIDALLSEKLCPKKIKHEIFSNKFLNNITSTIFKFDYMKKNVVCGLNNKKLYKKLTAMIIEAFLTSPSLFCTKKLLLEDWNDLLEYLSCNVSSEVLKLVLQVGFCLNTSPKTLAFQRGAGAIVVCHGLNEPTANIVQQYSPTDEETLLRMKRLRSIIISIKASARQLKLVTVARSIRDGYAPRSTFKETENRLLQVLDDAGISERHGWRIVYDEDLLNGKAGWFTWIG